MRLSTNAFLVIASAGIGVLIAGAVAIGAGLLSPSEPVGKEVLPPAKDNPLPIVSVRHDGKLHQGRQESYCWHYVPKLVCQDVVSWQGFGRAPAISVKPGDVLTLEVDHDDGTLVANIYAVYDDNARDTEQQREGLPASFTVDLSPGVYKLEAFYRANPSGDVFYGFKLDVRPAGI